MYVEFFIAQKYENNPAIIQKIPLIMVNFTFPAPRPCRNEDEAQMRGGGEQDLVRYVVLFMTKRNPHLFLLLTVLFGITISTRSFSQNNKEAESLLQKRVKNYKDIGLKMIFVDSTYDPTAGTHLTVQKGKEIIFRGDFINIEQNPVVFAFDTLRRVFLFTVAENAWHVYRTFISAIYDGKTFRLADTLHYANGSYTLKDLDSDRVKEILLRVDYFPYRWTSFSGTDYDLVILKIDSMSGRLIDVSAKYPGRIMKYVKSYLSYIRKEIRDTSMPRDLIPDVRQEELACLLMAYISLGKESEGWDVVRKEYRYKDKNRYFKELKEEVDKGRYLYGHKN